jgi:formylglycine-generating enzyme required for sulfatase activity
VSVLERPVFADGRSKPFGELTQHDVAARAAELRAVGGVGPTTRVVPVALAWAKLARAMQASGAATVGELGAAFVAERAEALWVVPPGGSLLG